MMNLEGSLGSANRQVVPEQWSNWLWPVSQLFGQAYNMVDAVHQVNYEPSSCEITFATSPSYIFLDMTGCVIGKCPYYDIFFEYPFPVILELF